MSYIQYNGITLPCNQTTKFDHKSVYDDSNTDWVCNQYDIIVTTLVNLNYLDVLVAALPADDDLRVGILSQTTAAAVIKSVRTALMTPRKQLKYVVDGVDLIPDSVSSDTVDARNGPKPLSFTSYYITGDTFLFVYHITASYWENVGFFGSTTILNLPSNPVLRNRWTERVEIDEYDMTTRTRTGSFLIRSDGGATADSLRESFAILTIPTGFLRIQRSYEISEDGLSLSYTTVDREQKKMPPVLVDYKTKTPFKANVVYKESTTELGSVRFGHVLVMLVGGSQQNGPELMDTAIRIGMNRFSVALDKPLAKETPFVLKGAEVEHDIYQNMVSFKAVVQYTQIRERKFGVAGFTKKLTADPIEQTAIPRYTNRGSAGLLLQAAAYYDPDIVENKMSKFPTAPTKPSKVTKEDANLGTQMKYGKEPGGT